MSLSSYRHNVALGVTGSTMPTCLPAALEQISPRHELEPVTYRHYRGFIRRADFSDTRQYNAEQSLILDEIAQSLGGLSCRDVETELVHNVADFRQVVRYFLDAGWRVAVNVEDAKDKNHTVGLLRVGEGKRVRLVSNYIPRGLVGKVTLAQVFPHLVHPDSPKLTRYNRYVHANVLALPVAQEKSVPADESQNPENQPISFRTLL